MHFDSRQFAFTDADDIQVSEVAENIFQTALAGSQVSDDTDNLDGDPSTDKFLNLLWVDISGGWHGLGTDSPVTLFDSNLRTASEFGSPGTTINFTADPAAGQTFDSTSVQLDVEANDGELTIGDASIQESENGETDLVFLVERSSGVGDATVDFATSDGTAQASTGDYQETSGTLTFTDGGATTREIRIPINGDNTVEQDETFEVTLSNASGVSIADATAIGTISNDDQALVSIRNVSRAEGDAGTQNYVFEVQVDNAIDRSFELDFATADDSAVSTSDYTSVSGTLAFAGDAGEVQTITVQVAGDTVVEPQERFFVNLSSLSADGRSVGFADDQANGVIRNDDVEVSDVTIESVAIIESDTGVTDLVFTVTRDSSVGDATVDFATFDGTAQASTGDYQETSGTLTFTDGGATTREIRIPVNGDRIVEQDETFEVTLSNASGVNIADATATGTISNDDQALVSIRSVSDAEGDSGTQNYVFEVSVDNAVDRAFDLNFATADGTAISTDDYCGTSGTITFSGQAGEIQTITVEVIGDRLTESDEQFFVNLSSISVGDRPIGFADDQAIGVIRNDDTGLPGATIQSGSIAEGDRGSRDLVFVVERSSSVGDATVDFATSDGTAQAGSGDYQATTGTLVFTDGGPTTIEVPVSVNGDNIIEGDETFTITLGNASGLDLPGSNATGTIRNDDQVEGDVLRVIGTSGRDVIQVVERRGFISVRINKKSQTFRKSRYGAIEIDALAGADVVRVRGRGELPTTVIGGDGDDTLVGGTGSEVFLGGDGADRILGRSGADIIFGGEGRDNLFGGLGADSLFGNAGSDRLFGESGRDSLNGDTGDDKLFGGAASDSLEGGSGSDILRGNVGNDRFLD